MDIWSCPHLDGVGCSLHKQPDAHMGGKPLKPPLPSTWRILAPAVQNR
jgi:hypothetical protein